MHVCALRPHLVDPACSMAGSSLQKHGSVRLLLLSFLLLIIPLLIVVPLLAGVQRRARELAALTPEGVHLNLYMLLLRYGPRSAHART